MSDVQQLSDLKREIVEARNQTIKTDNQVTNLSMDIKGFEKRFDSLERKTRLASLGVHAIVAVTIAVAAYAVLAVRSGSYVARIDELEVSLKNSEQDIVDKRAALDHKLATAEKLAREREIAGTAAITMLGHLANKRDDDAADLLATVKLDQLTPLEARLLEGEIGALRKRAGEGAYKAGKSHLSGNRHDQAFSDLRRSLHIDPEGRYSAQARYLLASNLYAQKRYSDAIPVLRHMREREKDKGILDEVRYLLANSLARTGKTAEAMTLFEKASTSGRYQAASRSRLAALRADAQKPVTAQAKPDNGNKPTTQ